MSFNAAGFPPQPPVVPVGSAPLKGSVFLTGLYDIGYGFLPSYPDSDNPPASVLIGFRRYVMRRAMALSIRRSSCPLRVLIPELPMVREMALNQVSYNPET